MEEAQPSPSKDKKPRGGASPHTPQSSRRTRSQAAPDWTVQEMLVLVGEIAAVDEDWLKALSSYQKWKMISDNCMAFDVNRSLNQCKRKWESLLSDYRKIRNWESRPGVDSFWCLDGEKRRRYKLPAFFEQEVFGAMDAVIQVQKGGVSGGVSGAGDSDNEELVGPPEVEILEADPRVDSDSEEEAHNNNEDDTNRAYEMANKLRESAQQVHTILKGELADDSDRNCALVDSTKPSVTEIELARRKADELIKVFGNLASTLHHFTELIKDGGCEEIRRSLAL